MKSDLVYIVGMLCLMALGLVSAFAFSEGIAKIYVGAAMGIIAAICGVTYHIDAKRRQP
jgi:integral membrane sensor domain MASE1